MRSDQENGLSETVFDFKVKASDQTTVDLGRYRGHALLIVNVASQCGFTPQYAELEELYCKFRGRNLQVLGFPCNQFGAQEPATDSEIQNFCQANYALSFPIMAKINVNGALADPLFQWLKTRAPGLAGTKLIKWNFTKFLVDRSGTLVTRFAPRTTPLDLQADIERALA